MKPFKTGVELFEKRREMFTAIENGESINVIAKTYETKKAVIRDLLSHYHAYQMWARNLFADKYSRDSLIRRLKKDGYSTEDLAELLDEDPVWMQTFMMDFKRRDNKRYFQALEESNMSKVNIYDVERFRDAVNVGQQLCFGVTEDGLKLYCIVEVKYPYWTKTDCGNFEWNWLAVMNKEMFGK